MKVILPAPIDSGGVAARRNPGVGLEAPNPVSGGLSATAPNLSMTFSNELYRRSGGVQGIAPTAEQLANQAAGGAQLSDYEWNSVNAGTYATTGAEEMLWHQTGGRLGLPGNPNLRQAGTVAHQQTGPFNTTGPLAPATTNAAPDPVAPGIAPAIAALPKAAPVVSDQVAAKVAQRSSVPAGLATAVSTHVAAAMPSTSSILFSTLFPTSKA